MESESLQANKAQRREVTDQKQENEYGHIARYNECREEEV